MKSTEKVLKFLEHAQEQSDEELQEAVPLGLPAFAIRGALAGMAGQLPEDPDELDEFLESVAGFCLAMRSDREPADV